LVSFGVFRRLLVSFGYSHGPGKMRNAENCQRRNCGLQNEWM